MFSKNLAQHDEDWSKAKDEDRERVSFLRTTTGLLNG